MCRVSMQLYLTSTGYNIQPQQWTNSKQLFTSYQATAGRLKICLNKLLKQNALKQIGK